MKVDPTGPIRAPQEEPSQAMGFLSGTRAQAIQRLQVGLSGLGAMILLVGLANVIMDRAQQSETEAVPEIPNSAASKAENGASDPLADAGVVPDVPDKPRPAAVVPTLPEDEPELFDVPPAQP